jgi:peptidoglycan-associated lipoprotein
MKKNLILFICLSLAVVVFSGCRTRTKPVPVQPKPPEVAVVTPPPVTPVEPPSDFVKEPEQPTVTTEELSANMDELNTTAQSKGWIQDAFFDYDSSSLSASAQDALSVTANWLKAHPDYKILIEGHCDERGTEQYNLALGDRRANMAKDYLSTLGVDASRSKTVSYGEERPFDSGHDDAAWAKNRRAHIVITGK